VKKYFLNFATSKNCSPFLDVLSERGVLLFIVETDSSDLQRLLSHFILTQYALDYRLSMPQGNIRKTRILVPAITAAHIRKTRILVPAITAALVLMMSPAMLSTPVAFAIAPSDTTRSGGLHFVRGTVDLDPGDGTLTATGEVAGAGTGAGTATLEADVSATLGCLTNEPRGNPGGGQNEPRGLRDVETTVTATAPFEPTRQGRGEFTVTTEEITIEDFDFECPSGQQTETLVGDISFTNIVLTIEAQTGTITATFPDQT
jgi:hypothetical protein